MAVGLSVALLLGVFVVAWHHRITPSRRSHAAAFSTTVVGVCFTLQLIGAAQLPGTSFELADDALGRALWRIAVATHTRIGFESLDFVDLWRLENIPVLPLSSRDEALRAAVGADSRYEWRALGDVVVVRPKSAWNDAANPFNRPVRNLRVENATAGGVFLGLRDFIYTSRFAVRPNTQGIPVSFEVTSGTVVDALNRFTESTDTVLWIASYRPHGSVRDRRANSDLQMQVMGPRFLHGMSLSESRVGRQ